MVPSPEHHSRTETVLLATGSADTVVGVLSYVLGRRHGGKHFEEVFGAQLYTRGQSRHVSAIVQPPLPAAYSVYASGAPSMATLIENCVTRGSMPREGYMYVTDPPRAANERRTEWQGWIEVGLIRNQFPEDSALARFSWREFNVEWIDDRVA